MAQAKFTYGTFKNGIPFLRIGTGPKTLLFLAGGPGNLLPKGFGASGFTRGMKAFTGEYTIYLVTRKSGLHKGYTTKEMSDDYAELISQDFGGYIDVVLGVSYGGLVAQHFAADYPEMFGHLVIAMSAHRISEEAKRIDLRYAELINQGRDREAMALRAKAVLPEGILRRLASAVLWAFGKVLLGRIDPTFRKDVLVEAKAELSHDSTDSLRRIKVPVLIVSGDDDFAFPYNCGRGNGRPDRSVHTQDLQRRAHSRFPGQTICSRCS